MDLDGTVEVVAWVNQFDVETVDKPLQVSKFGRCASTDEQFGLHWFNQCHGASINRRCESQIDRGFSATEILDPSRRISDQHVCRGSCRRGG